MVEAREPLVGLLTSWDQASSRSGIGLRLSVGLHALAITLVAALPFLGPARLPDLTPVTASRILLGPPLAAAAPLPLGSPDAPRRRPQPAVPDERARPQPIVAPDVLVQPVEVEAPLLPEAGVPESLQAGSPEGRPNGIAEGDRLGKDGGVAGGSRDGVAGGEPWGWDTGGGPVRDYDRGPRLVHRTRPVYPHDAFVQKVQGEVLLEILIDATGEVTRTRVLQSIPQLDAAAMRCVKEWRFEPALRGGRPVAIIAHAPVRFSIY